MRVKLALVVLSFLASTTCQAFDSFLDRFASIEPQVSLKQLKQSLPYKMAKNDEDRALVVDLLPYQLQLKKLDEMKYEITSSSGRVMNEIFAKELQIAQKAIASHGLHHTVSFEFFDEEDNPLSNRGKTLNKYAQSLKLLADFYYRAGHLRLITASTSAGDGSLTGGSLSGYFSDIVATGVTTNISEKQDALFQIFTAASLNHKRARFNVAFILENGLIPNREVIEQATSKGQTYHFLNFLVDKKSSILFKYLEKPADGKSYQMLAEFEADTKAQAISNLYLSSQLTSHKTLFEYMTSTQNDFASKPYAKVFNDFSSVNEANLKKMKYLEDQYQEQGKQAAAAQMSLGNRYQYGISVGEDCEASTVYYEAAARQTINYIERTHGLVGPERMKLSLMGPYAIEESFSLNSVISLEHLYTSTDVVELLDQQGQYGSTESLNFLGFSALMGKGKMERNFERAFELFTKALVIDGKDQTANYCLGLMYMLGMVPNQEADPDLAVRHYQRAGNDARAYNALGVIYYIAPDPFETDPTKLAGFKSIRRDRNKALQLLNLAAEQNNVQANFNLGAIHLDETNKDTFSFSKAYDSFKTAASLGHTLAAYNIGVMHFTGLGTFKSCNVANAFLKHVVTMGEDSIGMQRAYRLVEQGHYEEATWLYMELAEQGQGVAALNAALLLEKFDVFETQSTLLGQIATQVFQDQTQQHNQQQGSSTLDNFDINKQLAFRYLQISLYQKETEDEASLKIADFLYYGTAGLQDFAQALAIYKVTWSQTQNTEIRGHSLLKLGMIHQFGDGGVVDIDHDQAQMYYTQALKEKSSVQVPVYMMSLYSKWQRLDLGDTLDDFVNEFLDEPWSRGSILIVGLVIYGLGLGVTVHILRDDASKEDQ